MKSTFIFYHIIFVFVKKRDFFFYDFNFGLTVVYFRNKDEIVSR